MVGFVFGSFQEEWRPYTECCTQFLRCNDFRIHRFIEKLISAYKSEMFPKSQGLLEGTCPFTWYTFSDYKMLGRKVSVLLCKVPSSSSSCSISSYRDHWLSDH